MVPENTPSLGPQKVIGNSLGGREVLKAKLSEEKHEAKLEFPGRWGGVNQKTFNIAWGRRVEGSDQNSVI